MNFTKKILEITDLVLKIQELGKGVDGFPYARVEISNYGSSVICTMQENGFNENARGYDGFYVMEHDDESDMDMCILHLKRLLKKAKGLVNV